MIVKPSLKFVALTWIVATSVASCTTIKYSTLEKVGIHKRDVLVSDVEDARDAQKEAQEQFQDALERFGTVVSVEETSLKKAYSRLNDEYEDSVDAAEDVSDEIADVEQVAGDLFEEWEDEIKQYTDPKLKQNSERSLKDTKSRYGEMLASMKAAEKSMQPVLNTLRDNVLYLKHNLNAQAVGSLQGTFRNLEGDIQNLIEQMNKSIERSNAFIADMKPS